jgi:hypothetical protein
METELIFCAQLFFVEILRKIRGNPIKKCENWAQQRPSYVIVKGNNEQSKHAVIVGGIKSQQSGDGRFPHSTGTLTAALLQQ